MKPPAPKWGKPTKWERDNWVCTWGNDYDYDPTAPQWKGRRKQCGAHPIVAVDTEFRSVGRCAKHDPRVVKP
jgi:hypothetical protein